MKLCTDLDFHNILSFNHWIILLKKNAQLNQEEEKQTASGAIVSAASNKFFKSYSLSYSQKWIDLLFLVLTA